MSAERMRLIEEVFLLAAAARGQEREALLVARCGQDEALRREIESLLEHDAGDEEAVLSAPPIAKELLPRNLMAVEANDRLRPGTKVGAYTITGVLGSGGMGAVYLAEQQSPRRTVALKLIRPGAASGAILRRMQLEAELLGRLKHPGIAQIFEAGRADYGLGPQPYFAMEYVDGQMLDRHAESNRLQARERLEIMLRVCEAVEHAHQKGVIHRDLKPSNILVERGGVPKILDFGVARATGGDRGQSTQHTGIGQLIGTLPYMSPEQVTGDPAEVDTRSDVYALGVILFQLLSGRLPHDLGSAPIAEAARIIRDDPVPRLSSINREYRGDIETIVAKAMDKDRVRRYQSAADLAEDIRRFLGGLPIRARDDSSMYTLRKQIRRYQGVVAVASLAMIALSALSAYTTWLAQREREARASADAARNAAEGQRRTAESLRERAELQAERLRRTNYFSNIGFAQAAYASADIEHMKRLLRECPEYLRGWEWRYLHGIADASLAVAQSGEQGWGGATMSQAGDKLVTWRNHGPIRVWNPATHSMVAELPMTAGTAGMTISAPGRSPGHCLRGGCRNLGSSGALAPAHHHRDKRGFPLLRVQS